MKLKPYQKYRPSGVEWLGDIPREWAVQPLKRRFRIVGGSTPKSDDETFWNGDIVWVGPSDLSKLSSFYIDDSQRKITEKGLSSCGTTLVPNGSIVLSTRAPIGSIGIARVELCTNQGCKSLVPKDDCHSTFFTYLLSICTTELNIRGKGTTFLELSGDELGLFKIGVPEIDTQVAIAAFLDRETSKIDTLIAKQEKLIDLLKEKRQAVISHAISEKNAGSLMPLKRYVDLLPGYAFPSDQYSQDEDDVRLLRGINVAVGRVRWDDTVYWPKDSLEKLTPFLLSNGDVLFGMDRPWISEGTRIAIVTDSDLPSLLVQRVCRLRSLRGMTQEFLHLVLSSQEFRDFIEVDLTGVSVPHISPDQILSFRTFIPSEIEQSNLCKRVNSQFLRIDTLIAKADQAIALQREHRTALISAAVTGKIDVRNEASERKAA